MAFTKINFKNYLVSKYLKLLNEFSFDENDGTNQLQGKSKNIHFAYGKWNRLRDWFEMDIDELKYDDNLRFSKNSVLGYFDRQYTMRCNHFNHNVDNGTPDLSSLKKSECEAIGETAIIKEILNDLINKKF